MNWFQQAAKKPNLALRHPYLERIKEQPKLLLAAQEKQLLVLALHPETPQWLLERLEQLEWPGLGWLLHLNPQLKNKSQQLKQKFSSGGLDLALDPQSPGWLLERLAKRAELKAAVAMNQVTPPKVLQRLRDSKDPEVRRGVALNPACNINLLWDLAKDEVWTVRLGVAENQATPQELLQLLQSDRHPQVALRAEESLAIKEDSLWDSQA